MSQADGIYVTSRCNEGKPGWELALNLRPESEDEARQIEVARARGDTEFSLIRYCPYCDREHPFVVELPADLPEHLTPQAPVLAEWSLSNLSLVHFTVQRPLLHIKSLVALDPGTQSLPLPFRTPADAAARYNTGGQLVRNYSDRHDLLKRALVLLDQAVEIYNENKRTRDAGYAATIAAEGRVKLGRFAEARELLDQAFKNLQGPLDQRMRDHWKWVKEMLEEREANTLRPDTAGDRNRGAGRI